MKKLVIIFIFYLIEVNCSAYALDKNGNFESKNEQDKYIYSELKKTAMEINSQGPIMVDEETKFKSALALNKTLTFSAMLVNIKSDDLSPYAINQLNKKILLNMNYNACKIQATRNLIDLGVSYVYIYFGSDNRIITKVVLDKYVCKK